MGVIFNSIVHILLLLASALVIATALKNSIEWQVNRFGGESRDLWKNIWQRVIDLFGNNEPLLFIGGTAGFGAIMFWIYNSIFIFMDMTGKPAFLHKYKIQEGKNSPLTWPQLKNALDVVLRAQAFAVPITFVIYPFQKWRNIPYSAEELPSVQRLVWDVALVILLQAFMFHYAHRLLHHPRFYKRFHKVHHEWTAPISLSAVYAHPFEVIISNLLPLVIAPTIVGCHLATAWVWYVEAIVQTANDHSGYHFPFLPSPEFHDYHHSKFNQCFGVFGILDNLHGTDKEFLKSKESERHRIFFGFTPISHMIPDGESRKDS